MSGDLTLTLPDGARIVVPDDLRISSSYVLQEQQDWFEDEIRFLRVALQPGLRAIDAGANFGVYTLSLAQRAGTGGRVWAIEPGEQAANYLERSVAANGYTHVDVVRCALSAADGSGFLQTGITPELRRLVRDDSLAAVGVRSLDSLAAERRIDRVDFMKIDVEGEECNVLEGAAGFLEIESPLLMIEFWGDRKFNEEIFEPLLRHGYATFRLVPGINVLAPFYESEEPDAYQLNLFACKPARAAQLAEAGILSVRRTIENRRSPSNRRSTNCFRCHLRKASCRNGAVPPGKIPAAVRVRRIWRRCAGFLPRWRKPTVQRRVVGRSRRRIQNCARWSPRISRLPAAPRLCASRVLMGSVRKPSR